MEPHKRFEIDQARIDRAGQHIAAAVQAGRVPSAVLAIANHERVICCEAFSAPNAAAVTPDSIYLLASLSKPIMAIAVMQLVEDGLLLLDQPVATYLPSFTIPGKATLTAWHLLTHTSGIPEIDWPTTLKQRPERAVSYAAACHHALLFEPGSQFAYSTLAFYVLAELVNHLSGLPYDEYVRQRICAPLGMRDTAFDPRVHAERIVPVKGITSDEFISVEQATDFFISLAMPGAGLWSTAVDLIRLGQALLNVPAGGQHLLAPATLELMTREHTHGLVKHEQGKLLPVSYGLGWRKGALDGRRTTPGSAQVFEHDGATGGALWIDPEWDIVFVYLTNAFGADPSIWRTTLPIVYSALRPHTS